MTADRLGTIDRLRAALQDAHDWFESQAKAISKGCGSSWDLLQVREQRDRIAAELAAPAPPPADAVRALVGKWRTEDKKHSAPTDLSECADELEAALSAAPAGDGLPTEADFARIASSLAAQQEPSLPITSDMLADMLDPPAAATTPEGMTVPQIEQWIGACNHEPARQVLRHYLRLTQQESGRHG